MIYNNLDKHDILDFLDKILNISDKYKFFFDIETHATKLLKHIYQYI